MKELELQGKWVLITGASSGLGKDMAIRLAKYFHTNLIVVARRKEKLEELKLLLESSYQVQVEVRVADMSLKEDIDILYQEVTNSFNLYGVILNAGVTFFGKDKEMEEKQLEAILATNVHAMALLIHRFSAYFDASGREGSLLLIASMAALLPVPYQALYSGTKGFIYNYAIALSEELTNKSFTISIFAPGGIKTEMTASENFSQLDAWLMSSEVVAEVAIKGWIRRQRVIIPGVSNRLGARFLKIVPSSILLRQMGKVYRKALFISKKG